MNMTTHLYRIHIERRIGAGVASHFPEFTCSEDGENTVMRGHLPDQSALHGVLARIRDLGLTLISVETLSDDNPKPDNNNERNP
jgi:hypothetical protein